MWKKQSIYCILCHINTIYVEYGGYYMGDKIYFTDEEIKKAINFADKIKWKHPHFADKENNAKRTEKEIFMSVLRGKLAEIALKKYLINKHGKNKHKISELDFNIYKKGVCDDFDLKFDDYTISIKSSKPFASCLLIEKEKYELDENGNAISIDGHENSIPDFYTFIKVNIDYNVMANSYAYICGAISHNEFWKRKKEIPRGTYINKNNMDELFKNDKPISQLKTDKGVPLLASNYGLHVDLLKPF